MQTSAQSGAALAAPSDKKSCEAAGAATPTRTVAIVQTQAENAGAQEVARQLAQGFEKRGWRVRQVFLFRRTESFDDDANVFFCARTRPKSPLGVLKLLGELYKEFRRERPSVVITLQHYGNVIAAPIARLAGAKIVIANQLSAAELVPSLVRAVDRLFGAFGLYDHIVVNSAQTEADYRAYPDRYAQRLTRIDHGFFDKSDAISKADARRALGLPQDVELLGCAARLHHLKQIDFAIRALAIDDAQHLALAGQGADYQRLVEVAESFGVLDRIHFLGELSTARMGEFFAAIDCFVNLLLTGADISEPANPGPGLVVLHPAGVALMGTAGRNLTVMACAGLGGETGRREDVGAGPGLALLGDDVVLRPHSGVLGPVRVGHRVVVGVGIAVTSDVPDDTLVEGPRARLVPRGAPS